MMQTLLDNSLNLTYKVYIKLLCRRSVSGPTGVAHMCDHSNMRCHPRRRPDCSNQRVDPVRWPRHRQLSQYVDWSESWPAAKRQVRHSRRGQLPARSAMRGTWETVAAFENEATPNVCPVPFWRKLSVTIAAVKPRIDNYTRVNGYTLHVPPWSLPFLFLRFACFVCLGEHSIESYAWFVEPTL